MARGSSIISVKITGDNKGLRASLDDSSSRISKFAGAAGRGLKLAAGALGGLAAGAVIAGPKLLDMGNQLEAIGVKSSTVFGDSLGEVQAWADQVAGSMGLTSSQLTGAAANMGDLLKPMGFTADQAAAMSTEMVDLSGALSAWAGGTQDATQVSEVLSKAMLGEREGLKALGISISEADVQARLAANGTESLTGSALRQAKALATQELILEKSTDAQAAWADGSMDSLKASNEAKAGIEELKESFIRGITPALQALVPWVTKAVKWLGDELAPIIKDVAAWVKRNWPGFRGTMVEAFEAIRSAVETAWRWIDKNVIPILRQVFGWVRTEVSGLVDAWRANWDDIRGTVESVVGAIRTVIEGFVAVAQAAWRAFGDTILRYATEAWNNVKTIISGALEAIRGVIQTVTSLIRGDWSGAWNGLKAVVSGVWTAIQGIVDQALNVLRTAVSVALTALGGIFSAGWGAIKSGVSAAIGGIVGLVLGLPGRLLSVAGSMASAGARLASSAGNALKTGVTNAITDVVGAITGLPDTIRGLVGKFLAAGSAIGGAVINGIKNSLSAVGGFATDVGQAVLRAVKSVINTQIIDRINNTLEFTVPIPFAPDITVNPPDIPRLHTGGFAGSMGGPARELPYILQQGEFVLSRDDVESILRGRGRQGPLVGTINVVDGRDLTRELARVQALEAVAA